MGTKSAIARTRKNALGVFLDNRRRPIHRWYPFIEGYSSELVRQALEDAVDTASVFDPFGGSGTTALTAAMLGISSAFGEANPYMAWVTDVKVNVAARLAGDSGLAELRTVALNPRGLIDGMRTPQHPLLAIDDRRDYFPDGVALNAIKLLGALEQRFDGDLLALGKLAVATSLIPASNMIRRTDLRRRRSDDAPPANFWHEVSANLHMIVDDVLEVGSTISGSALALTDDAKAEYRPHQLFTTIVTSPPYLNGTNYGRNTKLELFTLGFLQSEAEIEGVRAREITAGINNVAKRNANVRVFDGVERVAQQVEEVAYDERIPKMVRGYFTDMAAVFDRTWEHSAPGAEFWLDIGDSRYAGIAVPTHTLLAEVAGASRWKLVNQQVLRVRRSYDGSPLSQFLMKFVREDRGDTFSS